MLVYLRLEKRGCPLFRGVYEAVYGVLNTCTFMLHRRAIDYELPYFLN